MGKKDSVEIMCKIYDDKPLTMKELDVAKMYNFDFKYGQKEFNNDLASIDQSIMYSAKINRHRKIKRRKYPKFRFAPSLGDIKENELFDSQLEHLKSVRKDFAAIHEERALNCGIPVVKDEGRYHSHKRHSGSSNGRA